MRNPTYEQALTQQGVQWTYVEQVPLVEINASKGLKNQARLESPLEDELVEAYTLAYKAKSEFPPLVLHKPGRGQYVPIDGNHRLEASNKAGRKWHDAYVVDVQDQMIVDRMTWVFNNLVNGKRLSREDCLQHAITFVRKYGHTCRAAAKEWGLNESGVNKAVRAVNTREKIEEVGVRVPQSAPNDVIIRLGEMVQAGDAVLKAAAEAVFRSGVSAKDVDVLAASVKAARNEEAKLETVRQFANSELVKRRQAETKGGRVRVPRPLPRTLLVRHLEGIEKLFKQYPAKEALRFPGEEGREARAVAREVVEKLVALYGLGVVPREEAS